MTVERAVFLLAGSLNLIGLALGHWVSPWFLLISVFVGVNMVQTAFTGWCLAAIILKKVGLKSTATCCAPGCCNSKTTDTCCTEN